MVLLFIADHHMGHGHPSGSGPDTRTILFRQDHQSDRALCHGWILRHRRTARCAPFHPLHSGQAEYCGSKYAIASDSNSNAIKLVLEYLNIQLRKIRRRHFQKYLEAYARALTSRDAEKYVDGEDEVIDFETIINEVALLRNRWLGVMKGLETKQWQMGHIVRLRTAGMEDIQV